MSGLEVAGLVLGAFPLAIVALEKYREVAIRFGMFLHIRVEYKHWKDDLRFYEIAFKRHLKQLLLPLIFDDSKIKVLISNPGSEDWKDPQVDTLLKRRLNEAHELYIGYMDGIGQVMDEINEHLALDSGPIQEAMNSSPLSKGSARIKAAVSKDGRAFQRYKVKFSNGESVRKRLFDKIGDYLGKMEKLLATGDEESRLVQQRNLALEKTLVDSSLCSFWITAKKLFRALASAWPCRCQHHDARLLLQHRDTKKTEFDITFTKFDSPCHWELHQTRVSKSDEKPHPHSATDGANDIGIDDDDDAVLAVTPKLTRAKPLQSSIRTKGKQRVRVQFSGSSTLTEICTVKTTITLGVVARPISNLCSCFAEPQGHCCGFLPAEDCQYYVYSVSRWTASSYPCVTLENILRREVSPPPSRAQRFALSLILASSFLQLLESPWLPRTFKKSDVLFLGDASDPSAYLLDQPQVVKNFVPKPDEESSLLDSGRSRTYADALDQLGIILLELCFGDTLEQQPYRKKWPPGETEMEKAGYDFLAAKEWLHYVNGEAGLDYADAVGWCLLGHWSSTPDTWRHDMLRRVIQPLQRCRDYLAEGGVCIPA